MTPPVLDDVKELLLLEAVAEETANGRIGGAVVLLNALEALADGLMDEERGKGRMGEPAELVG